jgi:hypothetical protein
MKRVWWAMALGLALLGCNDEEGPGRGQQGNEMGPGGAGGAGGTGGDASRPDDGAGGSMNLDQGPDASDADVPPLPDLGDAVVDGGPRTIEGCADLCGVYAACEQGALWPENDCLNHCAETQETPSWPVWRECLALAACDALGACVPPELPPPTCEAVCAAISACGEGHWPGVDAADCASTCAEPGVAAVIATCGVAVVDGACAAPDFARCFYEGTQPVCVAACDRDVGCGFAEAAPCVDACATPEDVLAQRRTTERATCVAAAPDCNAALACNHPPAVDPRAEVLCAADLACGQFPEGAACLPVATALIRRGQEDAQQCLTGQLAGCADGMSQCMVPVWGTPERCERACADRAACGFLYDGRDAAQCAQDCRAAFEPGAEVTEAGRYQRTIECEGLATCADLETCIHGFEARFECAAHCDAMWDAGARLKRSQPCTDHCRSDYRYDRWQAELHCQFDARDDAARQRCEVVPSPDCAAVCDQLGECGDQDDCHKRCDDLAWRDFVGYERLLSCVWASDRCEDRQRCWDDPARGDACLAWCVPGFACQGEPDGYLGCVETCALRGVGGYGGIAFRRIEACLAQQGRGAPCDVTENACPLPNHNSGYCPLLCDVVSHCGVDRAACITRCDRDFNEQAFVVQASDTLRAHMRGEGCEALLGAYDE